MPAPSRPAALLSSGRGLPALAYMSIGTGISFTFVLNGVASPTAHGAAILLGSGSLNPRPSADRHLRQIESPACQYRRPPAHPHRQS